MIGKEPCLRGAERFSVLGASAAYFSTRSDDRALTSQIRFGNGQVLEMRGCATCVVCVSVAAWSALLVVPLSAKTKPAAERAEKPSLEVEEKAQEAADRADRASDKAVRMLDRVIIKIRPKPGETKTPSDTWLTAKAKLALVA